MKKNPTLIVVLFIGLLMFVSSCVKDTFTEKDAYTAQKDLQSLQDSLQKSQAVLLDSLRHKGGVINYSVAAILASDANWLSNLDNPSKGAQQLDAVTVTIAQYGKVQSVTTGPSGIAAFKDLRIGTVNVNISKTGFTEVDFIAVLPALPDSSTTKAYDIVRNVGTMVPVFSLTTNLSTINGIASVESDLTNDAPEVAAGVDLFGEIDVNCAMFRNRYFYYPNHDMGLAEYSPSGQSTDYDGYTQIDYSLSKWWNFDYYGIIKQIAYHSTVSKTTTANDGTFSLKVPSTPDGLPIKIFVSEFALSQKLLQPTVNNVPVWGVQSIRTLFGPPVTFSYSSIPEIGTYAPYQVQSAFVTFSAPTGTPAAQPTEYASAQAVLSSSGIISVNISAPGENYTQPPLVKISKGSVANSVQAKGTAVLSGGRVTGITITNAGSGYRPDDSPAITFVEDIAQAASATAKMGFSLSGIALTTPGTGYTSAPAVTINSNSGTGATATANMSGYVSALTLTNPGSGYTATPTVTVAPSTGIQATATVTMTTANPIHSVFVPANLNFWITRKRGTRINGVGSGALADSTTLSTIGRISFITILNGGTGYITAPAVTISGGGGFGAVAHATLTAGVVTGIVLDNAGSGYTSDPLITLTPAPLGGTNATAALRREFQVTGVNVTASGNGYQAGTTVQFENAPGSGTFVAAPGGVIANLSLSIASLSISTAGTDYTVAPTVTIAPSNGVVTTAATATSSILFSVKNFTVTAQGSGYEVPNDITVTIAAPPVGGTQAVAGAVSRANGVLKRLILTNPGVGYSASPNVYISINPLGAIPVKQAEVTATVSGGAITGFTITDPGQGYNYNSDVSGYYSAVISTYSSSAAATANPNPRSGQIDFIQISLPGAGYAVVPNVEIVNQSSSGDANGFGKGATATAVVTDGRISGITVTNPGSGYYELPTVRITIPTALVKAVGMCIVDDITGRITGVSFPSWKPYTTGLGYSTPPTVTFTPSVPGKGTGATGIAVISDGEVVDVIMTNEGSGYLGKNNPSSTRNLTWTPSFESIPLVTFAGKTYVRDVNFGTGNRMTDEDYSWWD